MFRILPWVAVIAVLCAPLFVGDYALSLLVYVGLSAIVALGLVLLTGHAGLPSFAQATFAGIGAYVSALLTLGRSCSPWVTLPVALLGSAMCAWGFALVMVRLSGHYLSLATIALAVSVYYLLGALDITGGQSGLAGLSGLFADARANYWFVWLAVLGMIVILGWLLDSRMGRAIRALKDEPMMAEAMGIHTAALKVRVFVIACVMAGFSGWFYAYYQRFVNPSPFSLTQGIDYLFMTVLGGASMLWGAVAGAALVTLLQPVLQTRLSAWLGSTGNFESVVFGVLVILLFQFAADGLLPSLRRAIGASAITRRPLKEVGALAAGLSFRSQGPALSVSGACKSFGGLVANHEVTLTVERGQILALIGPNGAGKSTLFDLITGMTPADRGEFRLDGVSIGGRRPRDIAASGVGRSFQHVRLISDMSVIENVAIGAHRRGRRGIVAGLLRLNQGEEAAIFAEAMRQLRRVGLADAAWVEAGSLALGQQRLVEIARALAGAPLLLLLDEPAAGLRHQEKQGLARVISGLRDEGIALLLVEHDMDFVMRLADQVVVMEFGQVIAAGTPAQVQANPIVHAAYLGGAT